MSSDVVRSLSTAVLNQGFLDAFGGSGDGFQGVLELEWEKNYNFIFIKFGLKFKFRFNNDRRQENNTRTLEYNSYFTDENVAQSKHNNLFNNVKENFTILNTYKRTNVMQLGSMFICNCNIALHVSDAFCVHLQEHLETVEAASGE